MTLDFVLDDKSLTIKADGVLIATSALDAASPLRLAGKGPLVATACSGIYGPCPFGVSVKLKVVQQQQQQGVIVKAST